MCRRDAVGTSAVTTTTTVSLVPQHDATEIWDGGILDLLPLVDLLILSYPEARGIVRSGHGGSATTGENDDRGNGHSDDNGSVGELNEMARFFGSVSPTTYVIVTRGVRGAAALHSGRALCYRDPPLIVKDPVDPTGAGDAFAAGFVHGFLAELLYDMDTDGDGDGVPTVTGEGEERWGESVDRSSSRRRRSRPFSDFGGAVREGLRWGCAAGTNCVLRSGASVPASRDEIVRFLALNE